MTLQSTETKTTGSVAVIAVGPSDANWFMAVTYIGHYISTLYITYIRHYISALFNLSFMFIHCHKG